ncbi:MAG: dihydropteroate synthase [Myxococcota bacterium]
MTAVAVRSGDARPEIPPPIPVLMGIVNVTPDSFSDGGAWLDPAVAIDHALALSADGAAWIDVGGESTRPGAEPVDAAAELARVIPVIAGIARADARIVVSVDTSKVAVAERAIDAGATVINDVTGLEDPAMAALVARTGAQVVVMHMRGRPRTMQDDTAYADLVGEVTDGLRVRVARAVDAGVAPDAVLVDPGLGFGKDPADNPRLIAAIPQLRALGHRVVIGASRKLFVGRLTGRSSAADRVFGSVGAAIAAAERGADVVRVHDVRATRDALVVWAACRGARADRPQ